MSKLTVTQATAVKTLIAYLGQHTTSDGNPIATAIDAESALAILARDGFERMMAGPREADARAAIAAVEQSRAASQLSTTWIHSCGQPVVVHNGELGPGSCPCGEPGIWSSTVTAVTR